MLGATNFVVLAFLVFDAPLGQAARNLPAPLIAAAGRVTDFARLMPIVAAIAIISMLGLLLAHRLKDPCRLYRIRYIRRITLYLALSVTSASATANMLKDVIGRARPPIYEQYGIFGFEPFKREFLFESFPSAHSTNAGAFFMALALLFPRFRLVFFALAFWFGATRIILGVHYPSDVMAGLALGCGFALTTAVIFSRFGLIFATDSTGWPLPAPQPESLQVANK